MIKVVLFDIDGVLLDSLEGNTRFLEDLIVSFGYKKPPREKLLKTFYMSMFDAIKLLTNETDDRVKEIWDRGHTFQYPLELVKVPEHTVEVVNQLKRSYKVGIVTSRIKARMDKVFAATKMTGLFKIIVTYEDTKKHKPHPEPLLLAAKKLNAKPSDAVYIGDSEYDLAAARSAGMKFIFYSKKRMKGADARLEAFKEIPGAIEQINKQKQKD